MPFDLGPYRQGQLAMNLQRKTAKILLNISCPLCDIYSSKCNHYKSSLEKIHFKMSSGKWRPLCLGLNVLTTKHIYMIANSGCCDSWRTAIAISNNGVKAAKWYHDDVIKWRSPVNSPNKGQWRGVLMFSLISVWINGWGNNREAGDLRRYRAQYDVTLMTFTDWHH